MMSMGSEGVFVGSGIFKAKIRRKWPRRLWKQPCTKDPVYVAKNFHRPYDAMAGLENRALLTKMQGAADGKRLQITKDQDVKPKL